MNLTKSALAVLLLYGGTEAFSPVGRFGAISRKSHGAATSALHSLSYQNDGLFSFMRPFLEIGGLVEEGKRINLGGLNPLALTTEANTEATSEDAAKLRQQAAENLTNIDDAERARRDQAGDVMIKASVIYVLWASLIADDGDFSGHVLRFLAVLPIFLAYGLKESAKSGL